MIAGPANGYICVCITSKVATAKRMRAAAAVPAAKNTIWCTRVLASVLCPSVCRANGMAWAKSIQGRNPTAIQTVTPLNVWENPPQAACTTMKAAQ